MTYFRFESNLSSHQVLIYMIICKQNEQKSTTFIISENIYESYNKQHNCSKRFNENIEQIDIKRYLQKKTHFTLTKI